MDLRTPRKEGFNLGSGQTSLDSRDVWGLVYQRGGDNMPGRWSSCSVSQSREYVPPWKIISGGLGGTFIFISIVMNLFSCELENKIYTYTYVSNTSNP